MNNKYTASLCSLTESDNIEVKSFTEADYYEKIATIERARTISFQHSENYSQTVSYIFIIFSGLFTLAVFYIVIDEADMMDRLYPTMNYRFYIITPQHFSVPVSLYISSKLQHVPLPIKIYIFVFLSMTCFCLMPLIALIYPGTLHGFYLVLICSFVVYTFSNVAQSNLLAVVAFYPHRFNSLYFFFQPVFNLVLMLIKVILIKLGVSDFMTSTIVWGYYAFVCLTIMISLFITSKTQHFRNQLHEDLIKRLLKHKKEQIDYVGTSKLI